jgi:hypothetical protein
MAHSIHSDQYELRLLAKDEKSQAIALIAEMQGIDVSTAEQYFRWKYEQNPHSDQSVVYLMFHEGKAVALRGFFPMRFRVSSGASSSKVSVLVPSDSFVSPSHRRKGLFSRLTQFASTKLGDEHDFFLTTSSNYKSTGGYLKMGWRPLTQKYLIDRYFIIPTIASLCRRNVQGGKMSPNILQNEIDAISDLYSSLCGTETGTAPPAMICQPDIEPGYIKWRFSNPSNNYFAMPFHQDGELVSFLVGSYENRGVVILDYRVQPSADEAVFLDTIRMFCKSIRTCRIRFHSFSLSSERRESLCQLGFRHYQKFPDHLRKQPPMVPLLLHPAATTFDDSDWVVQGLDLRNEESWLIPAWCCDGV